MADFSPALQQALSQIPPSNNMYARQYPGQYAGQPGPVNYGVPPQQQIIPQQQFAPHEEKSGISLGGVLAGAALIVGAVATHKTARLGKAFEALKKASPNGSIVGEYKFAKNFLHNANPLNWFGNAETAKAAKAMGYGKIVGYNTRGESGVFWQHYGNSHGDILQVSGNKLRNLDGTVNEYATDVINMWKNTPVKSAATPIASVSTTPATVKTSSAVLSQVTNPSEAAQIIAKGNKATPEELNALKAYRTNAQLEEIARAEIMARGIKTPIASVSTTPATVKTSSAVLSPKIESVLNDIKN